LNENKEGVAGIDHQKMVGAQITKHARESLSRKTPQKNGSHAYDLNTTVLKSTMSFSPFHEGSKYTRPFSCHVLP
jgi:hypothetical protein